MPEIMRVKLRWDGFNGSPGYSVFHMRDMANGYTQAVVDSGVGKVNAFADALKGLIPFGATLTTQSDVEILDLATGSLISVLAPTATPAAVASLATAGMNVNNAVGASITWRTPQIRNGRRIRGRTFLVPLVSATFTDKGVIAANNLTQLNLAATNLRDVTTSPDLIVWARPTAIKDANGVPTGAYNADGTWGAINSHSIPVAGAVLRSRRD